MPPSSNLYPYSPDWQPVAQIGDYVALIRQGTEPQPMLLKGVFAIPLLGEVDFGAVNNGVTTATAKALISGADILEVGPDEFLQIRFALNPTDFTGSPAADISLAVWQPGPAQQRWATNGQVGRWDIFAQNMWTSLAPTELYSYYDQTPQFAVTNDSGGNIANSRVRFFAWHYVGKLLSDDPDLAALSLAPSGHLILVPIVPKLGRTSIAPRP